jgi:hypothetical protein
MNHTSFPIDEFIKVLNETSFCLDGTGQKIKLKWKKEYLNERVTKVNDNINKKATYLSLFSISKFHTIFFG